MRYAGAPLHYSFGEAGKPRGSWLVELGATGLSSVEWLELPVPRPLVTLRGRLDDLLDDQRFDGHDEHWVRAEYTDATPQPDPMRRLQTRFPWCATVVHLPHETLPDDGAGYARRVRAARDDAEVIDAFLVHVREGEGASDAERSLIREVLDARAVAEARA